MGNKILGVWEYLVNKVYQYLRFYGKLSMYAGVAYDSNGDSILDSKNQLTK